MLCSGYFVVSNVAGFFSLGIHASWVVRPLQGSDHQVQKPENMIRTLSCPHCSSHYLLATYKPAQLCHTPAQLCLPQDLCTRSALELSCPSLLQLDACGY